MLFQKNCPPCPPLSFHEIFSIFTCFFNLSFFTITGSFLNYLAQFLLFPLSCFILFFNFYQIIVDLQYYVNRYSVVLVSAVHESESVIHMNIITLFQSLFLFRSLQNFEQRSLCYTLGSLLVSKVFQKAHFLSMYMVLYYKFYSKQQEVIHTT